MLLLPALVNSGMSNTTPTLLARHALLATKSTVIGLVTQLLLLPIDHNSAGPFDPLHGNGREDVADSSGLGCLSQAADEWPRGTWAGKLARRGLTWAWASHPPRLRLPPALIPTSPRVSDMLRDMCRRGVLEEHQGPVFLSRPFTVPRRDRPEPRLVIDLSILNKYIACHRFRMVTLALVRGSLIPGAWFTSLDLANAYWHVPVHPRFRSFLAVQDGSTVLRFRVMPFGLNIAPRVFTKLTRTVASILADAGVTVLMYLDDWLLQAQSREEAVAATQTTLDVCRRLGFVFNVPKCILTPSQTIVWLGMQWDSVGASLQLSPTNKHKLLRKLRRTVLSTTSSHKLWASLMGSLNFAAQVVPLGRLWCRRLWWEGNRVFPRSRPLQLCPLPRHLRHLLLQWLTPGLLDTEVQWRPAPPSLVVCSDASDYGWGYQTNTGLQGSGTWSPRDRMRHINVRELMVPFLFLQQQPTLRDCHVSFHLDNVAAVQCVRRMGSSRSLPLLRASEHLFALAESRNLTLSASHLPGRHNAWADALSRSMRSSVEWSLHPDTFQDLTDIFGLPEVDLFAAEDNHLLPQYLTQFTVTEAGGPDALTAEWSPWRYVFLFPPPAASIMTQVCARLQDFRGQVLLIAPLWKAQPWCQQLLRWCPRPLPLSHLSFTGPGFLQSGMSSDFHAWNFCR